jgi:hypothetical protein
MMDLEQQLTDHLQRRAAEATPRYDLESIEDGISLVSLVDERDERRPRRPTMRTIVALAAALALVVAVLTAIALRDDGKLGVSTPSGECCVLTYPEGDPVTGASAALADRWLAFAGGRGTSDGVTLVRDGAAPVGIELPGSDTYREGCPAFSPQTATAGSSRQRLMISRRAYGKLQGAAELVIVDVARDGSVSPVKTIPLSDALGAMTGPVPCAIWSPDGSWAALGGAGAVWVVNTTNGDMRRLAGYSPTDIEWRPGTDELAFTGTQARRTDDATDTPVDIYTVSTGEVRSLGAVRATNFTWSPDGKTLAFTGGEDRPGIWLVNADGTNERQLTDGAHLAASKHGHGIMWSPDGRYIAYERQLTGSGDRDEVVLVTATAGDRPIGSATVIPPPNTKAVWGSTSWFPSDINWSPDGTHILYFAWAGFAGYGPGQQPRVLAVPIDKPRSSILITDQLDIAVGAGDGTPWIPLQQWSAPIGR